MSQHTRIIQMLKANKRRGVENWRFAREGILRYNARIGELRSDGWTITMQRDQLPNGRVTNTFRYFLVEEDDKETFIEKLKRVVK